MNQPRSPGPLTATTVEHGRRFLASLFMAVRTAQIYDASAPAVERSLQTVLKAAQTLYQATGGFSIKFVDGTVFLNGQRLSSDDGGYSYASTLHALMSEQGLGGLELHKAPSQAAIRSLVMLYAPQAPNGASTTQLAHEIRTLGHRAATPRRDVRVDRRVVVVQSYGKLLLALRERLARVEARRTAPGPVETASPRLKAARVIKDLVELCRDRADFLLRLSNNRAGASRRELLGLNTSLLSVVMGSAIGVPREELVDIGLGALLSPLGLDGDDAAIGVEETASAAVARALTDETLGPAAYARTVILGEQSGLAHVPLDSAPHPYAAMVRAAAAYQQLILGLAGPPVHPLTALARLHNDPSLDLDRRWIDLIINLLRTFPKGAVVVLDDGTPAEVLSQMGGTRWDRPMVRVSGPPVCTHDLMIQEDGRFLKRIRGTAFYCGRATEPPEHLEEEPVPVDAPRELPADGLMPFDALTSSEELSADAVGPLTDPEPAGADLLQVPVRSDDDFGDDDLGGQTAVDFYELPDPESESESDGDEPTLIGEPRFDEDGEPAPSQDEWLPNIK